MELSDIENELQKLRSRKFAYIEGMAKMGKKREEIQTSKQYIIYENEIVALIKKMSKVSQSPFPDHFPKVKFYETPESE